MNTSLGVRKEEFSKRWRSFHFLHRTQSWRRDIQKMPMFRISLFPVTNFRSRDQAQFPAAFLLGLRTPYTESHFLVFRFYFFFFLSAFTHAVLLVPKTFRGEARFHLIFLYSFICFCFIIWFQPYWLETWNRIAKNIASLPAQNKTKTGVFRSCIQSANFFADFIEFFPPFLIDPIQFWIACEETGCWQPKMVSTCQNYKKKTRILLQLIRDPFWHSADRCQFQLKSCDIPFWSFLLYIHSEYKVLEKNILTKTNTSLA